MANRLTDTNKWKKGFLKSLDSPYKLLWLYICDDCDHAGVWDVDIEVAEMRTGECLDIETAVSQFGTKITVFDGGVKWFIPSFIEFQYPSGLNPANKAHASVLKILKKYNLNVGPSKPLGSPLEGAKDKVKDKDIDKDIEDRGAGKGIAVNMVRDYKTHFPEYPIEQAIDLPACVEIANKIADLKGWPLESVTNGHMTDVLAEWGKLIVFARGDQWYSKKSIAYLNKDFQSFIQAKNGTHQRSTKAGGIANGYDPTEIERTGIGNGF